jgi:beta-N-acetylhexosaminidase
VAAEAARTAGDLRALGINMNCVPVVDLDEGNEANLIGDRTFGRDPDDVVRMAQAVIDAHQAAGIATCLKHFPGLGRTHVDSHVARPALDLGKEELLEREVAPFRLLADRCPAIMVSHVALPRLTGNMEPASLSVEVVAGLLRQGLGFEGVIASDDLAMGAVSDRAPAQQAIEALAAGCDLLLYCEPSMDAAESAHVAIAAAAAKDAGCLARLRESRARVLALRRGLAITASDRA